MRTDNSDTADLVELVDQACQGTHEVEIFSLNLCVFEKCQAHKSRNKTDYYRHSSFNAVFCKSEKPC